MYSESSCSWKTLEHCKSYFFRFSAWIYVYWYPTHTHTHWYTPQCVQKPLHAVGRLLFQHLDAALHLPDTKTTQGVRERSAASDQRISCCSHTDSKTHIRNSKWPHLPVSCWAAVIHEKRHVFIRYLTWAERGSIKGFLLLGLFDLNGFISLWR